MSGARVKAADTLSITYNNPTGSAIDPASETYKIFWFRPEKTGIARQHLTTTARWPRPAASICGGSDEADEEGEEAAGASGGSAVAAEAAAEDRCQRVISPDAQKIGDQLRVRLPEPKVEQLATVMPPVEKLTYSAPEVLPETPEPSGRPPPPPSSTTCTASRSVPLRSRQRTSRKSRREARSTSASGPCASPTGDMSPGAAAE